MNDDARARVSGRRLVSGVAWNVFGRGMPLLLALLLTPILVRQLGIDRWGIFTLALALVGVLGMLDLGVGPALTRALSQRIGTGEREGEAALVASAIAVLGGFSVIGAAIAWAGVVPLVQRILNVPEALQGETIAAMRVLVVAAPMVVINAALWGVLAAHQKFRAANLVTIPVSVFYYLGPVLVLSVWDSLVGAMLALVACRLVNTISYALLVRPLVPGLRVSLVRPANALPLLRIGGWMTFASALSQALNYADRFLVGALLTMAAVAFYATPLDLVMRLWIFPVAVAQALLPALASSVRGLTIETVALLRRGVLLIGAIVLPAALLLAVFAHPLLQLWLGRAFADGSAPVTRILAVGVLFSCLAFAPGSLIEAIGRPDLLARFTLAQAALFVPLSALLLTVSGIEGAAIAWALRSAVDCAGRLFLAARLYPAARPAVRDLALPIATGGAGLLAAALLPVQPAMAVAALAILACTVLAWRALSDDERSMLLAAARAPHRVLRGPRA
jgi:O-antigen/teichoic acid export membrane protein